MDIKFSVIITCYNESEYIGKCIQSVIDQSALNNISEIIVVNDGSTDNSKDIIAGFAEKSDKVIQINQINSGLPASRNNGAVTAKGNYFAFLDGDDYWHPSKIDFFLQAIKENPEIGLFYSSFYLVDGKRKKLANPRQYFPGTLNFHRKLFRYGGPIVPSSVVIKRKIFERVDGFDTYFRYGEDTEMWLRVSLETYFYYIAEPTLFKTVKPNSLGVFTPTRAQYFCEVFEKLKNKHPEFTKGRRYRTAKTYYNVARYFRLTGNRKYSVQYSLKSLCFYPLYFRSYANLLLLLKPTRTQ